MSSNIASPNSVYGREIKALFDAKRLDRFSIAKSFSGHVIVGEVVNVEKDYRGEPQDCPYSKIKALLRIES
jgi:hypothetical protein